MVKTIGLNLKQTREVLNNKDFTGNIFIYFKFNNYRNKIIIKKYKGNIEEITIIKGRNIKNKETFFKYHERTCKDITNTKTMYKAINNNKKHFTGTMTINKYNYSFNDLI